MEEHKDYMILPDPDDDKGCIIEVREGIYAGVQFRYGRMLVTEFEDDDYAKISIEHTVVTGKELILQEEDFNSLVGQILDSILFNPQNVKYTDDAGNTITGDPEPDQE